MYIKFSFKLFLATFLLGFAALAANAANAVVTNNDTDGFGTGNCATGGSCTLRQAINFVSDGGTITFDLPAPSCPNGVCTIPLNAGLQINKSMSIVGLGARKLIIKPASNSATPMLTIFTVGDNTLHPNLNLSGATVTGGYNNDTTNSILSSGILLNDGATVFLNGVSVINNGTFVNGNTPTATAGGIYNNGGTFTMLNSLVGGNVGILVGGIGNFGTTTVINSTIANNSGGVLTNPPSNLNACGGIYHASGRPLTLINSTIASNSAQFAASNKVGGVILATQSSPAYVRNTIIADNTSFTSNTKDVLGTFTSRGNNLINVTTGSSGFGAAGSNDIINQSANLRPLADNGGQTDTQAFFNDSPAINRGNNCVLTATCPTDNAPLNLETDQRGPSFPRQFGAAVDIGAYELQINVAVRKTPFDFDGDGKSDLAVVRPNGGSLTWYLLNSQSGFTGSGFGNATDRLVPADFDGDGKTDLAVVRTNADNSLTWYIQQSRDGFTGQTFGISGDVPVPADYDGDGRADVAVARTASGALSFYINRSQAGFTGFQFGAAGDVPVIGDFDGDGRADAAVVRQSGGNLTWYLNRSTAGFAGAQFGLTGDKLVAADYDGDGKTDLAITRTSGGNLTWYVQQSRDGFTGVGFGSTGDIPVPADYDGDGRADVAVARAGGGNLTWYLNRSQSGFTGIQFGNASDRAVENAYIP